MVRRTLPYGRRMETSMRAEIITIGDELLIGQVVDTNSAWIAQRLNEAGIELYQITSAHDNREHIVAALDQAFAHADIIFTTGGLGPTKDDITKHVMCEYFHTSLIEDAQVREHIYELYAQRPDVLNRLTATQWQVPASATILPNRVGSAPIMVFEKDGKWLFAMPGVPHEMQIAMNEQVLPFIHEHHFVDNQDDIHHITLMLHGIPESTLAIRIEEWENALPNSMHLAYLPKDSIIRLRLSSYGDATIEAMNQQIDSLLPLISDYLIATADKPLESILGDLLQQNGHTISTAESCTGGRIAAYLNAHSGASAYYMGSVVAYANEIKEQVLGVHRDTLLEYGAVSQQTVREMAEGVRRLMHTDYAIATSGIAGPTGGTDEKPVGTVWIAWATREGTFAKCFQLGKLREQITQRAVTTALVYLIRYISTHQAIQ